MNFPFKDDEEHIHVEACFTYDGAVCYKCPFCFTCKNGTGRRNYDPYNTPLTNKGVLAVHRINGIHIHGNLLRDKSTNLYIAEKGRSNTDNWIDKGKTSNCTIFNTGSIYIHVTDNTKRLKEDENYPKEEKYKRVLMPSFKYPTAEWIRQGEFIQMDKNDT